jgi:hypothetical protein
MITIESFPLGSLSLTIDEVESLTSLEMAKYIYINVSEALDDDYIEVTYNGQTITLLITDECRYTPIDIYFQNKEGAVMILPFFKSNVKSITTTSESFESDRGQPYGDAHQFVKYNINGKTKFKVNSGFVNEDMNDIFKQLMLTEKAWVYENDLYAPINIGSTSLEYKSRQKDRLINYEIEFDYAFNEINNV